MSTQTIHILYNTQRTTITIPIESTINALKKEVLVRLGYRISSQRLIYSGRVLEDSQKLLEILGKAAEVCSVILLY